MALTAQQRHDVEPRPTTLGFLIPVSFAVNGSELHYQVEVLDSGTAAVTRLEDLALRGAPVAVVLADQWMDGLTGARS